jgi:hypothetical protein
VLDACCFLPNLQRLFGFVFELTLAETRFKIECRGFRLLKNSAFNNIGRKATFELFIHDFLCWNGRAFNIASNAPCSPLRDREPQRVSRDSGGTGLLDEFFIIHFPIDLLQGAFHAKPISPNCLFCGIDHSENL